jgi:hypothetical protein
MFGWIKRKKVDNRRPIYGRPPQSTDGTISDIYSPMNPLYYSMFHDTGSVAPADTSGNHAADYSTPVSFGGGDFSGGGASSDFGTSYSDSGTSSSDCGSSDGGCGGGCD